MLHTPLNSLTLPVPPSMVSLIPYHGQTSTHRSKRIPYGRGRCLCELASWVSVTMGGFMCLCVCCAYVCVLLCLVLILNLFLSLSVDHLLFFFPSSSSSSSLLFFLLLSSSSHFLPSFFTKSTFLSLHPLPFISFFSLRGVFLPIPSHPLPLVSFVALLLPISAHQKRRPHHLLPSSREHPLLPSNLTLCIFPFELLTCFPAQTSHLTRAKSQDIPGTSHTHPEDRNSLGNSITNAVLL